MQDLQIKLLYEQYGWTPEQIGSLLNVSPSIIRITIEDNKFEAAKLPATQEETLAGIEAIKSGEVARQRQLTPIMATIELSLFQKIMDTIGICDSPSDIAQVVKAYKTLTQESIINTVVQDEKSSGRGPAIAVQIINEVA